MKFCMHLSTRIQDKQNELPLINCLTDLALEADVSGFSAISLTEHHLHENQGYQNSLLFASALAPRLTQATLILATVNPAIRASATFSTSRARGLQQHAPSNDAQPSASLMFLMSRARAGRLNVGAEVGRRNFTPRGRGVVG
jgi:hypothetical protein